MNAPRQDIVEKDKNLNILDHYPGGAFVIKKDFSVIYWNNCIEDWTKIPREEILEKNLIEIFPHLKDDKYLKRIEGIFEGAPPTLFSSLLHKYLIPIPAGKGEFRTHNTTVTPITLHDDSKGALFIIQDVTEINSRAQAYKSLRDKALREVEERKKAEERLKIYAEVFANTTEGIMITDKSGIIQSVNPAFEEITGYSSIEANGKNPRFLQSGKHEEIFYKSMWDFLNEIGAWRGEIWNKRKNGEIYPQEMTINAIKNEEGKTTQYACIFSDITKRKETEEVLRKLSSLDGLTGLANRRTFDNTLNDEWHRALRTKNHFSLIMVDIDFFKKFNDQYGHQAGDKCLKDVARKMKDAVKRPGDLVARYGGEEFVVVLPMTDKKNAFTIAEHMRKDVESLKIPHELSKPGKFITISLGVATVTPKFEYSQSELLEEADKALYMAKREGRNKVVSF